MSDKGVPYGNVCFKGGQVTCANKKGIFWSDRNFWLIRWPEALKFGLVKISGLFDPHVE